MAEAYVPSTIEPKWQKKWEEEQIFATPDLSTDATGEKAYIMDFFPYPSGSGLHVGHLLGYTGSDILARAARMQGKKVLHPMGWDSFGLPAENFAIKSGVHPAISTDQNIVEYKRQLRQVGMSYDWSKEIKASDPSYYKWTQWFFALLYERGLAYRKEGMVNWCPSCQTVLANEQVIGGKCERCGTLVSQRQLKQWYFKITQYAEHLLEDLDDLDWPERIKAMQRNWIGKSTGARLLFKVRNSDSIIEVFTTRPDTLFGATYLVLAPEHALVDSIVTEEKRLAVEHYKKEVATKTELERTFLTKEKTGVFTGAYAINPASQELVPIWLADYVIASYGTGAIMAVPAHDARDYEFAKAFDLPIQEVIERSNNPLPYTEKGVLINSGPFTGQSSAHAMPGIVALAGGHLETIYRLRDWLVSRQRFWGAPIPIAYDQNGQEHLVPLEALPVTLPEDVEFLPTGQSPLVNAKAWKKYINEASGEVWQREVDTLDTFVCSSWYYLRYPTPNLIIAAFSQEAVSQWLPVDTYIGGAEHAVLHLLYARFFTKVLYDAGLVPFKEPFQSLRNQGMILGPDHNKMSKSKGNIVNPDQVIAEYGADALRLYEMFMGPFETEKPWSTTGIVGIRRFLEKVWRLQDLVKDAEPSAVENCSIHRLIQRVTDDLKNLRFNTAVSAMMEALNELQGIEYMSKEGFLKFITILSPFAPHISEELWHKVGGTGWASLAPWPEFNPEFLTKDQIEMPVQFNGKVRFKLSLSPGLDSDVILAEVKKQPRFSELSAGQDILKEIVVPDRLVSFVTKPRSVSNQNRNVRF